MATPTTESRWDLGKLYAGTDDPRIPADIEAALAGSKALRERYYGKVAALSPTELVAAFQAFEAHGLSMQKLFSFPSLSFSADSTNQAVKSLLDRVRTELTEAYNELQFFDLELQHASDDVYQAWRAAPELATYHYYLESVRKNTPHTLSEGEEQLVAVKDITGVAAWSQLYIELTAAMKVKLSLPDGEREVTVSEARTLRGDTDREVRKAATEGVLKTHADSQHVLTYIFNTVYEDHRQSLEYRHYDQPMSPTLLNQDLPEAVVEALMKATESRYDLAQRYYRTKARVLGIQDFATHDLLAPYQGGSHDFGFDEGKRIVLDSFGAFSEVFAKEAKGFFDDRYIDVPPVPGKQGGAFCAGVAPGQHPFVLLNYTNKMKDVMTLAHELGHGIHFLLAGQAQTPMNYYPILPLAETASTFAELITVNRLLELEKDPAVRRQLLADRVEDAIATIMRQVMYTRWEQQAHARRKEGTVSAEEFCRLWAAQNELVYGDAVRTSEWDSWGWISIPHLIVHRFYCYSYAFGQLLVYALYQQYREEGEAFVPKFLDVLAAGGSAPAQEILARVGMDITDPKFWSKGLDLLEGMLKEFEESVA